MSRDHSGHLHFNFPELQAGTILTPPSPPTQSSNPEQTPVQLNVVPYFIGMPAGDINYMMPYGTFRLPRISQSTLLAHLDGVSQSLVAIGMHAFNVQAAGSSTADRLPTDGLGNLIIKNADDHIVFHHPETGAYMRVSAVNSTPTATAADGGPAHLEISLRNMKIDVQEYAATTPGGIPTAAKISITTPGGLQFVLDDKAEDPGAVATISTPGGLSSVYDDVKQQIIQQVSATVRSIIDQKLSQMSLLANGGIGIGDLFGNLPSTANAMNFSHIDTMLQDPAIGANFFRRDDLVKFAAAMVAAGVPSAGAVIGHLATFTPIPTPLGAALTRIKSA